MGEYIKVTNKVGAAMTVSSSIGADVWPLLTGLFIEKIPMIFMYLTFAPLASCFLMFLTALLIGKSFKRVTIIDESKELTEVKEPMLKD